VCIPRACIAGRCAAGVSALAIRVALSCAITTHDGLAVAEYAAWHVEWCCFAQLNMFRVPVPVCISCVALALHDSVQGA
jgi:hypothetical protein